VMKERLEKGKGAKERAVRANEGEGQEERRGRGGEKAREWSRASPECIEAWAEGTIKKRGGGRRGERAGGGGVGGWTTHGK